jgi:hypothetical protein
MPSDQSNAAGAFKGYLAAAGTHPTPTPIYHCAQPAKAAQYPNDRRLAAGAIPMTIVAGPGGGAIPVIVTAAPTKANAGAIPVWP